MLKNYIFTLCLILCSAVFCNAQELNNNLEENLKSSDTNPVSESQPEVRPKVRDFSNLELGRKTPEQLKEQSIQAEKAWKEAGKDEFFRQFDLRESGNGTYEQGRNELKRRVSKDNSNTTEIPKTGIFPEVMGYILVPIVIIWIFLGIFLGICSLFNKSNK